MASGFSCQRCYIRKVKCDRASPRCGACAKSNAECSPAVNTRTQPALKKRYRDADFHDTREQELVQRIQQLEEYLKRLGVDPKTVDSGDGRYIESLDGAGTLSLAEDRSSTPTEDASIEMAAMMNMFTGNYDIVYKSSSVDRHGIVAGIAAMWDRKYQTDGTDWLFGGEISGLSRHPDPYHVFHLWNVYRQNVQPLTQIVCESVIDDILLHHGPALNRENTDDGVARVEARDHAILFAIYLAALQTMDPSAILKTFGRPHEDLLLAYRNGVRHWLREAHFCRTMDVQILQALVIYLVALDYAFDPRTMIPLIALAKAIARRIYAFLAPPTRTDHPSLDLDLVNRLWWALLALEMRIEDRGGAIGQQSSRDVDALPLPPFVADSDLAFHPASNLYRGMESSLVPGGNTGVSKTFVCVRYETLRFAARLRRGLLGDTATRTRDESFRREIGLIDGFQHSIRKRLDVAGDHSLRFANMWFLESMDDLRLFAGLDQERQLMLGAEGSGLRSRRFDNLELCMSILSQFVRIHQDSFFRSAGWYHQITSWVSVILHLFRLCRLLVLTDEALVRRAWSFVDANYSSTLGGVALRHDPSKPGTLDKAMLSAWDGMMQIAAASRNEWGEFECIQAATARGKLVSRQQLPTQGPETLSQDARGNRILAGHTQSPMLVPNFPELPAPNHASIDPISSLYTDIGWAQPPLTPDWFLWQDAL